MKANRLLFYFLQGSELFEVFMKFEKWIKKSSTHSHWVPCTLNRNILEAFFKGVVYPTFTKILATENHGSWR